MLLLGIYFFQLSCSVQNIQFFFAGVKIMPDTMENSPLCAETGTSQEGVGETNPDEVRHTL